MDEGMNALSSPCYWSFTIFENNLQASLSVSRPFRAELPAYMLMVRDTGEHSFCGLSRVRSSGLKVGREVLATALRFCKTEGWLF